MSCAPAGMIISGLKYAWNVLPVATVFKSSMQPTSTTRWPASGSRPVVSVSRTISRMESSSLLPTRAGKLGCESFAPWIGGPEAAAPLSQASDRLGKRGPRRREAEAGRDDDGGLSPFLRVRHLLTQDAAEALGRHARSRHD